MNAIPNRRGLLLGSLTAGAAATVAAIPGIVATAEPDSVLGLLEAHKATWARFMDLDGSDHELFTEAAGPVDAALDAITSTPPTTVAGMRTVMEYPVGLDGRSDYLPTLLRSSILRSPVLA